MLKVFKYLIKNDDHFSLELPIGARILKVEEQHGKPCLWALVNPENKIEMRYFRFAGTGHPICQHFSNANGIFNISYPVFEIVD